MFPNHDAASTSTTIALEKKRINKSRVSLRSGSPQGRSRAKVPRGHTIDP